MTACPTWLMCMFPTCARSSGRISSSPVAVKVTRSMFKSMRWRLLAWYVCLLFLVVAGFGSVLYYQVRKARFDEVDAELQAGARVLEGVLRGYPPPVLDGILPPREPPPDRPPREPPPWEEERG